LDHSFYAKTFSQRNERTNVVVKRKILSQERFSLPNARARETERERNENAKIVVIRTREKWLLPRPNTKRFDPKSFCISLTSKRFFFCSFFHSTLSLLFTGTSAINLLDTRRRRFCKRLSIHTHITYTDVHADGNIIVTANGSEREALFVELVGTYFFIFFFRFESICTDLDTLFQLVAVFFFLRFPRIRSSSPTVRCYLFPSSSSSCYSRLFTFSWRLRSPRPYYTYTSSFIADRRPHNITPVLHVISSPPRANGPIFFLLAEYVRIRRVDIVRFSLLFFPR